MKVRVPIMIVLAVGLIGAQPVLGARQTESKSNGDSASAVYVRGESASPNNCGDMTNLVDNQIPAGDGMEVVIKSSGNVESMTFKILDTGKEVASGDLDIFKSGCGENGVFTVAALDFEDNEGVLDGNSGDETVDRDDDNAFTNAREGSITVEILDSGKKFGSDSLRIG